MTTPLNKVLIVDDTPKNIQLAATLLQNEGYEIHYAMDGFKALEILRHNLVDLILLDVMMPEMDGFEVCKKLKAEPAMANIPVIFLTAKSDVDGIKKGFELGAVDYITKPFYSDELLARVRTHLALKSANEELHQKNLHLEKLNNEKNELLKIVSHDLKNPLAVIISLTNLLQINLLKLAQEDLTRIFSHIMDSAQFLLSMVNNLLDVNRLESENFQLHNEDVDLKEILQELTDRYSEAFKAKNLTFNGDVNDQSLVFTLDRQVITQILDNLISNAIKFSPGGKKIGVQISRKNSIIHFEVKDEGPGLTDDDKAHLFQKFRKLSAQPTGKEHSTGLGLSIVRKLVELMDGKIWAESDGKDKGSSFIFQLPIK